MSYMLPIAKRKAQDNYWTMSDNTTISFPFKKCNRECIPYIMAYITLNYTPHSDIPYDFKKYIDRKKLEQHTREITKNVEKMEKSDKNINEKASIYFNEDLQYLKPSYQELMISLIVEIPPKGNIIGYRIDPFFEWVITKWSLPSKNNSIGFNIKPLQEDIRKSLNHYDHCLCGKHNDLHDLIMIMPGTEKFIVIGYDCIERFTGVNMKGFKNFQDDTHNAEKNINNYNKKCINNLLKKNTRIYNMLEKSESKTKQLALLDDISKLKKLKGGSIKEWGIVDYLSDLSKILILNGFITLQKRIKEWASEYTKHNYPDINRIDNFDRFIRDVIDNLNSPCNDIVHLVNSIESQVKQYRNINNRVYFDSIPKGISYFDENWNQWYVIDDFNEPDANIKKYEKKYKNAHKKLFINNIWQNVSLAEIGDKMRGETDEEGMEEILEKRRQEEENRIKIMNFKKKNKL